MEATVDSRKRARSEDVLTETELRLMELSGWPLEKAFDDAFFDYLSQLVLGPNSTRSDVGMAKRQATSAAAAADDTGHEELRSSVVNLDDTFGMIPPLFEAIVEILEETGEATFKRNVRLIDLCLQCKYPAVYKIVFDLAKNPILLQGTFYLTSLVKAIVRQHHIQNLYTLFNTSRIIDRTSGKPLTNSFDGIDWTTIVLPYLSFEGEYDFISKVFDDLASRNDDWLAMCACNFLLHHFDFYDGTRLKTLNDTMLFTTYHRDSRTLTLRVLGENSTVQVFGVYCNEASNGNVYALAGHIEPTVIKPIVNPRMITCIPRPRKRSMWEIITEEHHNSMARLLMSPRDDVKQLRTYLSNPENAFDLFLTGQPTNQEQNQPDALALYVIPGRTSLVGLYSSLWGKHWPLLSRFYIPLADDGPEVHRLCAKIQAQQKKDAAANEHQRAAAADEPMDEDDDD